jgi:hypothetical protein
MDILTEKVFDRQRYKDIRTAIMTEHNERQMVRQINRQACNRTERHTGTHYKQSVKQIYLWTGGWTDRHMDKHKAIDYSIQTIFNDRHTYTQTVEKTDRRLDEQADSHKERQSNSHYGKT